MRRTNINAVLRMVREYLNGDMNEIDFYLDFPYEIEKRYQKMCREDPDYADLIYYYLVENGTVLAPDGISHSGPGGNRQLWPDENSQS